MTTIEIGGGRDPVVGAVNFDINHVEGVDVQMDATAPWPIKDESVERIEVHQTLEHISSDDLHTFFAEAYRVLESGGEITADVPLAFSKDFANDPTHKSSWYPRTPRYFTDADPLSYETGGSFELTGRRIRIYLTSGNSIVRPFSWLLKRAGMRWIWLVDLVKLPFVTGMLDFRLRKP